LEEIIHVSNTHRSQSLSQPTPRNYPASESTTESNKRPDLDWKVSSVDGKASKRGRWLMGGSALLQRGRKRRL
jgi:hypothetical protein